MCSRTVLNELKNQHSQKKDSVPTSLAPCTTFFKACHIILFVVTMLVLLNEIRSCRGR